MQSRPKYVWRALNRTLTTMDELETVIEGAAKDIGICELKEEQYIHSWAGKMCLFPCRQGMASQFASPCYRWFSTVCVGVTVWI